MATGIEHSEAEADAPPPADPAAGEAEAPATPGSPVGWPRRAWAWAHRHPLLVVLVVASALAAIQCAWIWQHRLVGALDPDEAGYIATTFRFQRTLLHDPLAMPRAIGGTGNGPLVPLLSVPLLLVGPDDPRTVLMAQPILMVVTAVAAAGIARRLAGSGAAMVTGIVMMALPTVVFATQTYWLGLGAAAAMALGAWALVSSDRLQNRWTYAYGACTGAMLLCRTMTLGFLPAMVLAGVVVAGRDRRSWVGLAKALGVTFLVAFPWWFVARHAIFDYLFSYGYGARSRLFGEGGPRQRWDHRVASVRLGVGAAGRWALVVVAFAAFQLVRTWHGWPRQTRHAVALAVAIVAGMVALASTSNNGVWFELPIIALLVPLVVAFGSKAPDLVKGLVLIPVAVVSVLQLGCSLWLIAPGPRPVVGIATVHRVAQYEYGFEQYDRRFGPEQRDQLREAAGEWAAASRAVEAELRRLSPDGSTVFTTSGNFEMFNTNTVELEAQRHGWTPRLWVPDTVGGPDRRARYLTPGGTDDAGSVVRGPDGRQVERVLVIARHDQHLFTPDERVDALYREARAAGWEPVWRRPLPVDGEVVVLRHPDRS
ncbi:MAG: hypothetical protein U0P45_02005 [Acidimicrobiales bacterium]